MSTTSKNRGSHTPVRSRSSPVPVPVPAPVPSPPPPDIRSLWRALPPGPCPSPRSHDPTDREIIGAIATVWCLYWNSFSTMDAAGLRIRILAKHPSWNLSEKRVQSVRKSALADGRLRRPAFEANIRMQPTAEEVCAREHAYEFDPLWRMVGRAQVCELLGSFEITSGEVVWGQLPAFVAGMKCASRDRDASDSEDEPPWRFRAAAKNGTWRISRVNAAPDRYSYLPEPTGFLLHHSDVSASVALLRARCGATGPPCIARLGFDGWDPEDRTDALRTVSDADPEEWGAAWARRWQMYIDSVRPDKHHEDGPRWARLDALRTRAAFFADAAHAPEVLRCVSRSSMLDENVLSKRSSSLRAADHQAGEKASLPFGCHLFLPGPEGDELARLVFSGSKSQVFPDDDELVAFWYDSRHMGYDDIDLENDPAIDPVRG